MNTHNRDRGVTSHRLTLDQVIFIACRVLDIEVASDLGDVEDGYRDGEGK
jgi:hypothetical protein